MPEPTRHESREGRSEWSRRTRVRVNKAAGCLSRIPSHVAQKEALEGDRGTAREASHLDLPLSCDESLTYID
jgi:hypothetical protein